MSQVRRQDNNDDDPRAQSPKLPLSSAAIRDHATSHSLNSNLIPRDFLSQQRPDGQTFRSANLAAAALRRPTPSPLHTSFRPGSLKKDDPEASSQSPRSPTSVADISPLEPESLRAPIPYPSFPAPPGSVSPSSSTTPIKSAQKEPPARHSEHGGNMTEGTNYHQSRKVSDAAGSIHSTRSPPSSPASSLPSMTGDRPGQRVIPRTSSIDSAISSLSSASHSHKSSFDSNAVSPADINNLVSAAGSAEALIVHLLKEKHHAASQNAQLWRLVDKQRALVLGLNKDLERALKDKERYRKKVKELQSQAPPLPVVVSQVAGQPATRSDAGDGESGTLPIQDIASAPGDLGRCSDNHGQIVTRSPMQHVEMVPLPLHVERVPAGSSVQSPPGVPKSDGSFADNGSTQSNPNRSVSGASYPSGQCAAAPLQPKASFSNSSDSAVRRHPVVGEALPMPNVGDKMPPPSRKPPPAPLNLGQGERASAHLHQAGPDDSESDYDDILEVDEIPTLERGRRKTREEDDKEREAALMREKEARSRSKKKILAAQMPEDSDRPECQVSQVKFPSSPRQMVAQSPPSTGIGHLSPPESLASVLSPQNTQSTMSSGDRRVASPPMSPGLPMSPRPSDRPIGSPLPRMPKEGSSVASPPMSPRTGMPGLPLSPRAPKYPIPLSSNMPAPITSPPAGKTNGSIPPHLPIEATKQAIPSIDAAIKIDSPHSLPDSQRGIYQGLVSDEYPGLLLPPNALPSIEVKVSSSRLRPSRNSYLALKPSEEEPVFTLSVFSRSDQSELWRVEKVILALPQLDQQIRQLSDFSGKLPDRSIFSGHSPAKVDARRAALNAYFESLLDTPMDETAALVICRFLTSDAIEPRDDETTLLKSNGKASPEILRWSDGKPRKEGYLTKRGKNFGGWKARYFVLHGPELKYFESPGGPHLGTIKIYNAQIGKQSQHTGGQNPQSDDDSDNQYRHAFLILEPKKKDSSALVRHVLCAESDEERDAWVDALLRYVETQSSEDETSNTITSKGHSQAQNNQSSSSSAKSRLFTASTKKGGKGTDSPDHDSPDTVQGFSYDDAVAAEPPVYGPSHENHVSRRSPTRSGSLLEHAEMSHAHHQHGWEQGSVASNASKMISAPTNGAVIQDAGAWGNRPATTAKEKKRSIWGFRTRSSSDLASQIQGTHESSASLGHDSSSIERRDPVRPVFGIPLAEAVEFCPPRGIDVDLPAVVYRCIEYLRAKGAASEEGIFRLSGSNLVVKALKERFNTEGDVDFLAGDHYYDVHAVASLFKQYLRELPSTVLTRELHLDFLRVLELDERQKKIAAFNSLVHRLPRPNLALLRALSQFLIIIINNSDVNKMTVRNVGIVFAPTLNIPAPVFSMFLTDFDSIFGVALDISEKAVEVTVDQSLAPDEIRSPRHQMFSDIPTPAYDQASFQRRGEAAEHVAEGPRATYDTGFIPLQPAYEQRPYGADPHNVRQADPTQLASWNRMLAPNADSYHTSKAKRRESSLLFMDIGQRKNSMSKLQEDHVAEESAFE